MSGEMNDTVRQGQLLRQALAEHIRLAKKMDNLERAGVFYRVDASKIVKQYVPEGCTFDYAESVLRSAGFNLDPRPTPESPSRFIGSKYEFDVNAGLGVGYGTKKFEGCTYFVALRPAGPYDYNQVHRVMANCEFSIFECK